ncbi:MAG: ribosomal RNA small subunit methyltransferase A [Ignavibacteria bacterium]|nr:MAG: ribosomal RNA small subunit methyltransferase A [Ignavibacteria bacterium]
MKPLKKFGQNYLNDANIIKKIVDEFNPQQNDTIIEIGPGRGALTKLLSDSGANIIAVEIDTRVIEGLKKEFPNVEFINDDFLKMDLAKFGTNIRVIGNIPYNITSPILFKLFENNNIIQDAVLMMQDEVAKRLIAKPNTKDYGILSVLTQFYTDVKYCFKISPNVFYPKPKVNSAVVHLIISSQLQYPNKSFFNKVVKASFGNRRKTLKNSLKNSIFENCEFENIEFDFSRRAENLSLDEFIKLAILLENKN